MKNGFVKIGELMVSMNANRKGYLTYIKGDLAALLNLHDGQTISILKNSAEEIRLRLEPVGKKKSLQTKKED